MSGGLVLWNGLLPCRIRIFAYALRPARSIFFKFYREFLNIDNSYPIECIAFADDLIVYNRRGIIHGIQDTCHNSFLSSDFMDIHRSRACCECKHRQPK